MNRIFDCTCHSHKIEVSEDGDGLVWLVMWERGGYGELGSGRNRLKRAWGSLRGRDSGVCSEVVLDVSDARRLGFTLTQLLPDSEWGPWPSLPAATASGEARFRLCADGSPLHDFKGQASCPKCGWEGITREDAS